MRLKRAKSKYSIPWKIKSLIFSFIDFFSLLKLLYFLQKYITKRSEIITLSELPDWRMHKDALNKYKTRNVIFEFGAGKSLIQNLYLSSIVKKQFVVDLYPMLDFELVDSEREKLLEIENFRSRVKIKNFKDLEDYGIYYIAPYDATKIHLSDKSIDACISTNTLEHIPKFDIISIFSELYKKLKDEGIVSLIIDYSDHYAHTDNNISLLNFLMFSHHQWKRYNHEIHFQNRLRHYEYIDIFEKIGFRVIKEDLLYAEKNIPSQILNSYKNKNPSWKATSAHIILKKLKSLS
ncbi:class I SAM-dependent methyltransferase [Prochlorococcus sp. AH-736-N17]|nr:class I SAM-dependent methyltransferase [Prochlorococcus sp. AH-736-N17]MDA9728677.1 class I SAM-dependent methyltransferase [Prochlorococcus sp. AH-736-N17]